MDVKRYANQLKDREELKKLKGMKAHEVEGLITDIHQELQSIFPFIARMQADDAIRWLIGWNRYVRDKLGEKFTDYSHTYARGERLYVDLFGHLGRELTYAHPAVVLYNGPNWLLVAPTSSPAYQDGKEFHIDLSATNPKNGVKKNCAILMDKIRVVDKQRVINRLSKITNTKILNAIDALMLEKYTPKLFEEHQRLMAEAEEIPSLNQKIDLLEESNAELQRKLMEQEQELKRYKQIYEQDVAQ